MISRHDLNNLLRRCSLCFSLIPVFTTFPATRTVFLLRHCYILVRRPDKDKSKRTPYCYFSVPDDDATHVRLEVSSAALYNSCLQLTKVIVP